jgi:beta-glucosidase-like glycosyl hydrolase
VSQLRRAGLESPGPRVLAAGSRSAAAARALATASGGATAGTLRSLGFNLNFAPVADVDAALDSPVIGARAVSADPAYTATWCAAWIRAHQAGGVAATAKHFPGHGAAAADSHLTLPVVGEPRALLKRRDLPPFLAAARAGVAAMMTAHVRYPALDPRLPATLSPRAMALLRGTLKFDGLVVTDSMDMAGVRRFGDATAAVKALQAGCDLLLYAMPGSLWHTGYRAVAAAVKSGQLPRARVEQALERVERAARKFPARARAKVVSPPAALVRRWDRAVRAALVFRGLPLGVPAAVEVAGGEPFASDLAAALRRHGLAARCAPASRARRARSAEGLSFGLLVIAGRRGWERAETALLDGWRREGRPFGVVSLLSERRIDEPPARGALLLACPFENTPRALEAVAARIADPGREPARRPTRSARKGPR